MALETTAPRTVFPCNTCSLSFTNSEAQRSHMRTSWHLHNLQRKMSNLESISLPEYEEQESKSAAVKRKNGWSSSNEDRLCTSESQSCSDYDEEADERMISDEEYECEELEQDLHTSHEQQPTPSATTTTRCLFCPLASSSTGENLSHMSSVHGFNLHPAPPSIPSTPPSTPPPSSDNPSPPPPSSTQPATTAKNREPLLAYLSLVLFTYHECVYCGAQKRSVSGVQSHMRDKRHCRVEWEDYMDFLGDRAEDGQGEDRVYEVEEESRQMEVKKISGTELRLPSGVTVNSRRHHCEGGNAMDGHVTSFRFKSTSKQRARRGRPVAASTNTGINSGPSPASPSAPTTATTHPSTHSTALTTPSNHPPIPHSTPHTIATLPKSRSTALSLSGLSDSQLRSLATLDKKMQRQQGTARKKVAYAAQQQPVKTVYYKTENPVYQAG